LTKYTIEGLVIGIIFLVLGIGFFIISKRKKSQAVIPIIIGVFLIFIEVFGPLSKSQKIVNEVQGIDSSQVYRILLRPSTSTSVQSLINKEIVVTNRGDVNRLCLAMHHAVLVDDNFLKSSYSGCRIMIELKNKKNILFAVRINDQATALELNSNGESGWHYAKLEATEFGQVLKEVCK